MKKIATILGGVVLLVSLTGCIPGGVDDNGNPKADLTVPATVVFEQPVPQGGTVTCAASKYANSGGLSCDWVGYHLENSNNE